MLTIGTDCSGIEAPIEALRQLGIPFVHKWACEKDKFARMSIMANCEPEVMYTDITERDHTQLPDVDLYVCGFPCQSFSLLGRRKGTTDPRGNIMLECINVIKAKRPNVFILENVKNFKFIQGGTPFKFLINSLSGIKDERGDDAYHIKYDVYNTKDYGVPQHRERVYIIGIKYDVMLSEFKKPRPVVVQPFDNFVIDKTVHPITNNSISIRNKLNKVAFQDDYIFPNTNYGNPRKDISPTLSTKCGLLYHSTYHRYLTTQECLMLQGFRKEFRQAVSNTQLHKQIGNSMSVNVVKAIMSQIIHSTTIGQFIDVLQ